ncbi:TPA: hypothetical protein DF272_02200 [Candidatus Falkowbacteria bacterium]|nr:hypothetical protein [Candidatus Falkowbacteria bacterium]
MFNWLKRLFSGQKGSTETYTVTTRLDDNYKKNEYKITVQHKPANRPGSPVTKVYFVKAVPTYTSEQLRRELAAHMPKTVPSLAVSNDKVREFIAEKMKNKQLKSS